MRPLLFVLVSLMVLLAGVSWVWASNNSRSPSIFDPRPVAPGEYKHTPAFEWPETNKTVAFSPGPGMGSDSVVFTDPAPPKVTCVMETTCGSM